MSSEQILKDSEAFGKLERDADGSITRRHLLIDHMIDVAACFERLARCRSIRRALDRSAGPEGLSDQDIARLTVLAFLHDIGKANSGFQAKRWKEKIPRYWPVQITAGHGSEALKLFEVASAAQAVEPLIAQICTWGDACDPLLIASISHHGRLLKDGPKSIGPVWTSYKSVYDPALVLAEIAKRTPQLYPVAFQSNDQALPENHAFGHLFAGLVQLADWLGSDTRFFEFTKPGESRAATAPGLANGAITTLGLDAENWREKVVAVAPLFADVFDGFEPRPIQAAMSDDNLLRRLMIIEGGIVEIDIFAGRAYLGLQICAKNL